MKKTIWRILLGVGSIPFLAPFLTGLYTMAVETGWTWGDWLILYSVIYWPTYLIGLILIAVSAMKLMK